MNKTRFTKEKLIATKPKQSNGYCYVDIDDNGSAIGRVAATYSNNAEHDAYLFSVSNEMYALLGEIHYQLGAVYGERIEKLLAKARGES